MSNKQGYKDPDYMKKWREANKDKVRKQRKNYYEANKDRTKEEAVLWAKENAERVSFSNKAKSANQTYPGHLTVDDIAEIVEKSGRVCHWCGKENLEGEDLTLEHLKPTNDKRFLAIACNRCNAGKLANSDRKHLLTEIEKKEKNRNRANEWYEKNSDRAKERQNEYYHKTKVLHPKVLKTEEELKETVSTYNKKYAEEHKDEINARRRKRNAEKRAKQKGE